MQGGGLFNSQGEDKFTWSLLWQLQLQLQLQLLCSVLLRAIQDKYFCAKAGPGFEVQFEDDIIRLEIPDDGVSLQNGWEIKPLIAFVVSFNIYKLLSYD